MRRVQSQTREFPRTHCSRVAVCARVLVVWCHCGQLVGIYESRDDRVIRAKPKRIEEPGDPVWPRLKECRYRTMLRGPVHVCIRRRCRPCSQWSLQQQLCTLLHTTNLSSVVLGAVLPRFVPEIFWILNLLWIIEVNRRKLSIQTLTGMNEIWMLCCSDNTVYGLHIWRNR
jgi:hypothetical protein